MRRDDLHIVDMVAIRDHLGEIEGLQRLIEGRPFLIARGREPVVEPPRKGD